MEALYICYYNIEAPVFAHQEDKQILGAVSQPASPTPDKMPDVGLAVDVSLSTSLGEVAGQLVVFSSHDRFTTITLMSLT